jgi:type IV pilus assembly protein PilM
MVEHLLAAVRAAGLHPEGVDLSAFAMIRSLYVRDGDHSGRILYLNVDGLANLAIAEGTVCRFTRVLGGGLEDMAGELAERRGIPVTDARTLLQSVDLTVPVEAELPIDLPEQPVAEEPVPEQPASEADGSLSPEEHEAREASMGYSEAMRAARAPVAESPQPASDSEADVRAVLENGIREISGEVRNSLDFHRTQEGGGEVSHVALSGGALDLPGFPEALQTSLGLEVRSEAVGLVDAGLAGKVSTHRLAIATGLAAVEAPE